MSTDGLDKPKTMLEEVHEAQRLRAGRIAKKVMDHIIVPWTNEAKNTLNPDSKPVAALEIVEAGQKTSEIDKKDIRVSPVIMKEELETKLFRVIMTRTVEAEGLIIEFSDEDVVMFTVKLPVCPI